LVYSLQGSVGIAVHKFAQPSDESFGQAFSNACAVEAAEASSPSAEGETFLSAFSFASFSLAPSTCKRKADKQIVPIEMQRF